MKLHLTARTCLAATLAAAAATAWAANETLKLAPSTTIPTVVIEEHEIKAAAPLRTEDTLGPDEALVPPTRSAPPERASPGVERGAVAQPPIVIEQRAMTFDERIQSQVMDELQAAGGLAGKIGVESRDAVITLTGYTLTAAQAHRAGRTASRVPGVRGVDNRIRARIGGSV